MDNFYPVLNYLENGSGQVT